MMTGADITYRTAHWRLVRFRGPASDHTCECGCAAFEWAYQGGDPNELVSPRGHTYSTDMNRYKPMCRSCHRKMDGYEQLAQYMQTGEKHPHAKLSDADVVEVRKALDAKESQRSIARRFGISQARVWEISRKERKL